MNAPNYPPVERFDQMPPWDQDAEMSCLASLLMGDEATRAAIRATIGPDDYLSADCRIVHDIACRMIDAGAKMDTVTVRAELERAGRLAEIGDVGFLATVLNTVPWHGHGGAYAEIVREKSVLRRLAATGAKMVREAYEPDGRMADELAQRAVDATSAIVARGRAAEYWTIADIVQDAYLDTERNDGPLITTGFPALDAEVGGLGAGEQLVIGARPSMGKAQPLDASVLTGHGWAFMHELRIGDQLASIDGQHSVVTGIFPRGRRQVYSVRFADGRSAECCAEHLWEVGYRGWDKPRVVDTTKLALMLERKRYKNRLYIRTFSGEFGGGYDLPIHPWVLGALIGDASICGSGIQFTSADAEIVARMRELVGDDINVNRKSRYCYSINGNKVGAKKPHRLKQALMDLGLWGCESESKFIPDVYMNATLQDRIRLLSGLIDTDGWVETFGVLRFCTCSEQLARNVIDLVRSIGGSGSYTEKQPTYTHKGEKKNGKTSYVCNLQIPDPSQLTVVHREKRRRLQKRRVRQRRLNVVSITATRVTEVQCITVSHPSHLYITNGFTVTHNSTLLRQMAVRIAKKGIPVGFISLEENTKKIARNVLSAEARVENNLIRKRQLSDADRARLAQAVASLAKLPIVGSHNKARRLVDIRALVHLWKARHGVKVIMLDYLQRVGGGAGESAYERTSDVALKLSDLWKETEVAAVVAAQLNRKVEGREDKRPNMADLRDSGQIEQDADGIIFLHREDYYRISDESYRPTHKAELIVAKWRDAVRGGVVTLGSDMEFQTFLDYVPAEDPFA